MPRISPRIAVYGLLCFVVILGITATVYLQSLNVHDYANRRSARVTHVTITDESLRDSLRHAFAFRPADGDDSAHRITFQSGMCLLAYRAQQGQDVSSVDRLVQLAVVRMWREPWMQEYSRQQLGRLRQSYGSEREQIPTAVTLAAMNEQFVDGLWSRDGFESELETLIREVGSEMGQTLAWEKD